MMALLLPRSLWILLALILKTSTSHALQVTKDFYNLGSELEYLIDNTGDLQFEQILKKQNTQVFISPKQKKWVTLSLIQSYG